MHTLIVYFSYSGNNRMLAEYLGGRIGCEAIPIVEEKRRHSYTILLDMMLSRMPAIRPLAQHLASYDHVVLVAPIWGGKLAHPMHALIKQQRGMLNRYSFISLSGYAQQEQVDKVNEELIALAGHAPIAHVELNLGELFPPEKRKRVSTVSAYRARRRDLDAFLPQIDAFIAQVQEAPPRFEVPPDVLPGLHPGPYRPPAPGP